jgi:hypothetical protein
MLAPEELDRAVRDVEERVQIQRHARDRTLLRNSVGAWCEILGWAPEVSDFAMSMDCAHAAHLGRIAIRFEEVRQHKVSASKVTRDTDLAKRAGARSNDCLRADRKDYTDASDEAMSKMEPRDYILIALSVAAAGYVVYRLTRTPQRPAEVSPVITNEVPTRWILVLVINAGRESVIGALRSGGVAAVKGDQLYQATQALWLGPESEFRRSNLSDWFSEARAVPEPSEYDVHLVRVELSSDDPGLHRNANQMDRLDVFRRFQSIGCKATVSPRLPSEAYGTTDVYAR